MRPLLDARGIPTRDLRPRPVRIRTRTSTVEAMVGGFSWTTQQVQQVLRFPRESGHGLCSGGDFIQRQFVCDSPDLAARRDSTTFNADRIQPHPSATCTKQFVPRDPRHRRRQRELGRLTPID